MNPTDSAQTIDPKIYALYDEYCHGGTGTGQKLSAVHAAVKVLVIEGVNFGVYGLGGISLVHGKLAMSS